MKKNNIPIEDNNVLKGAIAPMGLDFSPNTRFYMGDYICRIYVIMQYPPTQDYGWIAKINNITGTTITITSVPIEGINVIEQLSKIVNTAKSDAINSKDTLIQQRKLKIAEDTERLMIDMDQYNISITKLCFTILVTGNDEMDFQQKCTRVESVISGTGCKLRCLSRLQNDALKHILPSYKPQEIITDIGDRPMPVSAFYGGFPFANNGYNDGTGYYIGIDADRTPVIFDVWKRTASRTNSNINIIGGSGKGKTTLAQHIAVSELIRNTKVIIIDPESEYKPLYDLFKNDGIAKWINACGGKDGMINPLQIRPKPLSDEEENQNSMSQLALHLKNLEIFFDLYLSGITDLQKALLNKSLVNMYAKFKIKWDTDISGYKNNDYPIMTDLYNQIKDDKTIADDGVQADYDKLIMLLDNIVNGADKYLWNGYTTLQTNARLVVIDTAEMKSMTDAMKSTQYFNLLSWCWQELAKNPNEKVMVICDEAWLMINKDVPQALNFLRDTSKRARKYQGSLVVSTQNVVDFLDTSVKMYGQPILDLPSTKFIFGCDGSDIKELTELYDLNATQKDIIQTGNRGECLMITGKRSIRLKVQLPDKRLKQLGNRRGE